MISVNLAAGMLKTLEDVRRAVNLPVEEITLGSITAFPREGNAEPNAYTDGYGNYWNALGLPNPGLAYYRQHLPEIAMLVRTAGKKFVISISGMSPGENFEIARDVKQFADEIELNLACPNVVVGTGRKPLIGYTEKAVRSHFGALEDAGIGIPVRLKMPPYTDFGLLEDISKLVLGWHDIILSNVVAVNTLPNCLPINNRGGKAIKVNLAGGSGAQLHSLALANVEKWRSLLPATIGIIGAGGVREAQHVRNFEAVGAISCQMAGAYYFEGEGRALQHVLNGL